GCRCRCGRRPSWCCAPVPARCSPESPSPARSYPAGIICVQKLGLVLKDLSPCPHLPLCRGPGTVQVAESFIGSPRRKKLRRSVRPVGPVAPQLLLNHPPSINYPP